MTRCRMPCIVVTAAAVALTVTATAADALPGHIRLLCPFDESLYGCQGAANPFPAAGHVKLVPNGR